MGFEFWASPVSEIFACSYTPILKNFLHKFFSIVYSLPLMLKSSHSI